MFADFRNESDKTKDPNTKISRFDITNFYRTLMIAGSYHFYIENKKFFAFTGGLQYDLVFLLILTPATEVNFSFPNVKYR